MRRPIEWQRPSLRRSFLNTETFVWQRLRQLGVPDCDVDDVTQEVFLVVQRKLHEFEGRSSLRTWLYAIALRKASDYRRRARHYREELMEEVPDTLRPPGDDTPPQIVAAENALFSAALKDALELLDDNKPTSIRALRSRRAGPCPLSLRS